MLLEAVIERVKALVGYQYDDDENANAVEDHYDVASGGAGFMYNESIKKTA